MNAPVLREGAGVGFHFVLPLDADGVGPVLSENHHIPFV